MRQSARLRASGGKVSTGRHGPREACNAAAGDAPGAEGLSGLAKAFFYAGARALLVSHWSVQSDAAVKLTTHMLAEAADHPESGRAEALRRSMLALMNDPDNPHFAPCSGRHSCSSARAAFRCGRHPEPGTPLAPPKGLTQGRRGVGVGCYWPGKRQPAPATPYGAPGGHCTPRPHQFPGLAATSCKGEVAQALNLTRPLPYRPGWQVLRPVDRTSRWTRRRCPAARSGGRPRSPPGWPILFLGMKSGMISGMFSGTKAHPGN